MQLSFIGTDIQLAKLSKLGDILEKINSVIDWEVFRKPLEDVLRKADYSKGGRPPWCVILMLKIVMLMDWYKLSYHQAEYQCNNRLDFMRFLGIECGAKIPDENTIWDFKEAIKIHGIERTLFEIFNEKLEEYGYQLNSGSMIDASFVEVPKRRVISETQLKEPDKLLENESINVTLEKADDTILVIANDDKTQNILSQTDFEARWTKKNNQTYFGYKDHTAVDKDTKFITNYAVTSAEVHDSQVFLRFISRQTNAVWADSAYLSEEIIVALRKINPEIMINICHRAYRNKPLTDEQKAENSLIAKVRARVEHVFGRMEQLGGMVLNCIGLERAQRDIGLKNLGYNIQRFSTLKYQKA